MSTILKTSSGRTVILPTPEEDAAITAAASESEPFLGTTTHGELRVMCGVTGSYTRMRRESGAQCLPARWRAEGFETYGFHGFSMKMFDRVHWWPLVGLTPQTFTGKEPTHCNATFAGVCDEALLPGRDRCRASGTFRLRPDAGHPFAIRRARGRVPRSGVKRRLPGRPDSRVCLRVDR